jgi:ubiquinone/menaquinone biosynthesis C-methylase UbiE
MGLRDWIRPRLLDWTMRQMNELRPEAVAAAEGDVLEVGFGTGLNLGFYPSGVKSVTGLDPRPVEGLTVLDERLARAAFPVECFALRADAELPFDAGRFDCVVTTWTLCSIPDQQRALAEMRRVLKPGGRYAFIEHGRAPSAATARWQDRLNPLWRRIAGGCNMNRPIDRLVEEAGFRLTVLERFRHTGPAVLAHFYRGVATRSP